MHYVVLDTDVASRAIKGTLGDPLATRLTGMAWCVTFVTVGELWQWATTRSWEPRTREDLELWLGRVVVLNSADATARTWAGSRRRRGAGDVHGQLTTAGSRHAAWRTSSRWPPSTPRISRTSPNTTACNSSPRNPRAARGIALAQRCDDRHRLIPRQPERQNCPRSSGGAWV
jgi:predicted nucleic acid-binding protein